MQSSITFSRRSLLAAPLLAGFAGAPARGENATALALAAQPSLRDLGKKSGITYGLCEPATWSFPSNRGYFEQLSKECNIYVPGNEFNWKNVERSKGARAYGKLDAVVNFMKQRDVGVVGHTLLWYHSVPDWLKSVQSTSEIAAAADSFVNETVTRFRGSVVRWDVINEQVRPDGSGDGLRPSFFLEKLGPGYLKQAFATARAADPNVMLCYNEFGFEYKKSDNIAKRAALLALLRKFRDDKVEVDCVGLQSHLDAGLQLDLDGLSAFMREVKALGYKTAITELDVIDENVDGTEDMRDQVVADHVKAYLDCVAADIKPVTITSWGFTDSRTWLTMWHRRKDGRALRPLPFDDQFNRKKQWATIAQFMQSRA